MNSTSDIPRSTDNVREAQIAFALSIEAERRRLVSELAERFVASPAAATAFRHQLRDLRLLGREVGGVAFGGVRA